MAESPTEEQRRTWMSQWRSAAVELERVRQDEFRAADLGLVAMALEDVCLLAVHSHPPEPTSGLVVLQRLLHRQRPT